MRYFRSPSRFRSISYVMLLVAATGLGLVPWRPVARAQDAPAIQSAEEATKPPQDDANKPASFGTNLDFEEQADGRAVAWGGGGKGYALTADGDVKHSGERSGKIASDGKGIFGTHTQCIAANPLRGKRVVYSGFLKTAIKDGTAGLWMRVDGPNQQVLSFDNMSKRPIKGNTEWKEYKVVLDVPESATKICFGFLLHGDGLAWGDDLKIHIAGAAGEGPELTDIATTLPRLAKGPLNADFETADKDRAFPKNWGGGGKGYRLTRDTDEAHAGKASGRVAQEDKTGTFGSLTQSFDVHDYLGKRIKYSGYLKSAEANAAGLWMRVDRGQKPVSFDNMQTRPVRGTTEWTEYEIVLDVPTGSTSITYGFLLIGAGTVWGDDLKVEVLGPAGEGPETTGIPIE